MLPVCGVVPLAEPEVGGGLHDDEAGHVGHGALHVVGAVRQPREGGGGRVDEVEQPPVLSSQPGHAAGDNEIFLQGIMRYFSSAQSTVHLSSVLLPVSMVLGPDNPDDEMTTDQYPRLCYSVIPVCYYTALFVLAECLGTIYWRVCTRTLLELDSDDVAVSMFVCFNLCVPS